MLVDTCWSNACPPLIDCDGFMPNRPYEGGLFAEMSWVPNPRPVKLVVPQKVALPLVGFPISPEFLVITDT